MVLHLLQRLFVSRRIILLTVELNGLKKWSMPIIYSHCHANSSSNVIFRLDFFLNGKKYPNTFGNEKKTHRKMWKNMEITKKSAKWRAKCLNVFEYFHFGIFGYGHNISGKWYIWNEKERHCHMSRQVEILKHFGYLTGIIALQSSCFI